MDFVSALKAGGHGVAGGRRTFGRDVLVAGQIALAMVVLIAAGMFLAGFRKMLVMAPEFRTDRLISMDTAPAAAALLARTDGGFLSPTGGPRSHDGRRERGRDDGIAAFIAFANDVDCYAGGLSVSERPREDTRVRSGR